MVKIQPLFISRKNPFRIEAIPGVVTLYQVAPPSKVRKTYALPIAQPLDASIINSFWIFGESTISGFTVGGGGVSVGVSGVKLGVITGEAHAKVCIIWVKTTDSTALSKTGGGVSKFPGWSECRTKSMLMQALFLRVE